MRNKKINWNISTLSTIKLEYVKDHAESWSLPLVAAKSDSTFLFLSLNGISQNYVGLLQETSPHRLSLIRPFQFNYSMKTHKLFIFQLSSSIFSCRRLARLFNTFSNAALGLFSLRKISSVTKILLINQRQNKPTQISRKIALLPPHISCQPSFFNFCFKKSLLE